MPRRSGSSTSGVAAWQEEFHRRLVVEYGANFAAEAMVFVDSDVAAVGEPFTERDRELMEILAPAAVLAARRHGGGRTHG